MVFCRHTENIGRINGCIWQRKWTWRTLVHVGLEAFRGFFKSTSYQLVLWIFKKFDDTHLEVYIGFATRKFLMENSQCWKSLTYIISECIKHLYSYGCQGLDMDPFSLQSSRIVSRVAEPIGTISCTRFLWVSWHQSSLESASKWNQCKVLGAFWF